MRNAFVGLGFHLKYTKSSQFFIDRMREDLGSLRVFTSDWNWVHLPHQVWDTVVFYQHIPPRDLLDAVTIRHVVLVPMYDDCPLDFAFWDRYRDCSVVCFSSTLAALLEGWGHRVHRVRYAPSVPAVMADWSRGPQKGFFWPRKADLSWAAIRPLLAGRDWESVHLHVTENSEVLTAGLSDQEKTRLNLTQTRWFAEKDDYLKVLATCQVFFAPRRTEGIGMSFLEAMAMGLAVVAPDGATMNEYIQDGVNGFLYDPAQPKVPDWSLAKACGQRARQTIEQLRAQWDQGRPALAAFLRQVPIVRPAGVWTRQAQKTRRPVVRLYFLFWLSGPLRWVKRTFFR